MEPTYKHKELSDAINQVADFHGLLCDFQDAINGLKGESPRLALKTFDVANTSLVDLLNDGPSVLWDMIKALHNTLNEISNALFGREEE